MVLGTEASVWSRLVLTNLSPIQASVGRNMINLNEYNQMTPTH